MQVRVRGLGSLTRRATPRGGAAPPRRGAGDGDGLLAEAYMLAGAILIRYLIIPLNNIKWHTWNRVEWIHVLDSESYRLETRT